MSLAAQLDLAVPPEGNGGPQGAWPPPSLPHGVVPTKVFDTYWRFAAERQAIFFRRLEGTAPPWTADPILREYRFTNAYRASDRVSQYLIRRVIYAGSQEPEDLFFRILLFKLFNRIETWQLLERQTAGISLKGYEFSRYDRVLDDAMRSGEPIYSAAYIMPSGHPTDEARKHRMHLRLLERMISDGVPNQLRRCSSMAQGFDILRSYPTIGDFLAYQFITDINYSTLTDFSEMEFVVPGPGAKDGIRKCFQSAGTLSPDGIVRMMAEIQEEQFGRLGLTFRCLWGRRLQLVDCQNLFCEVDKYSRQAHPDIRGLTGRTRIKQHYRLNTEPITYWYPPKWKLDPQVAPSERRNRAVPNPDGPSSDAHTTCECGCP
jgi:hypothetical protein